MQVLSFLFFRVDHLDARGVHFPDLLERFMESGKPKPFSLQPRPTNQQAETVSEREEDNEDHENNGAYRVFLSLLVTPQDTATFLDSDYQWNTPVADTPPGFFFSCHARIFCRSVDGPCRHARYIVSTAQETVWSLYQVSMPSMDE